MDQALNQALLKNKDLLNKTVGAEFLGCIFASLVYGATNLQVYIYYRDYPKDARYQRIAVGILWALDTINLALSIISIYKYVVIQFGDMLGLLDIFWPLKVQITLSCVIAMTVQTLYVVRLWKLGRSRSSWVIPITVVVLDVIGIGEALMLVVKICQMKSFTEVEMPGAAWIVFQPFTVLTVIDLAIAGSMWWYLSHSKSSFQRTNNMIMNIMRLSLVCGLLTSACSVALLIVYGTVQINLIWLSLEFLLTKFYVLSYVSMLTARHPRNYGGGASSSFGDSGPNMLNINTTITSESCYPSPTEKASSPGSPISETGIIAGYTPAPPRTYEIGQWRPYVGGTRGDRDLSYFV